MNNLVIVILAIDGALLLAVFAQLSRIERRLAKLESRPQAKRKTRKKPDP